MGRPKKAGMVLASVEECVKAMGDLLAATIDEENVIAKRDRLIAKIQARYEPKINDARGRRDAAGQALEDYYYAHIPEIEKNGVKHLDLANGVIGRRDNPQKLAPLNRSWTWQRITDLAQVLYKTRFLLDPKPAIDRDKIKAELAVEELKELGLKLEQGETFYALPARLPGGAK